MPFPCDPSEGCDGTNGVMLGVLPCSVCDGGVISCGVDCSDGDVVVGSDDAAWTKWLCK